MKWSKERIASYQAWDNFWSSLIGVLAVLLLFAVIVDPFKADVGRGVPVVPAAGETLPVSLGMN